jgi:hypothetical protein
MRHLSRIEIAALSPEQRARLGVYGARWEALRGATTPPDYAGAAGWVRKVYVAAGLPPPPDIIWAEGPADLAAAWAKRRGSAGGNVRALVVDAARRKAEHAVDRALSLNVRMALAAEAGLARVAPFCVTIDEIVERICERASPLLRSRFAWLLARRRRAPSLASGSFSFLTAAWLGALEYLHDVCGLRRHAGHLAGLWEMARHAALLIPHERACWLMPRPLAVRRDANGNLHAADGPALRYGDGCKVYAWKGVVVPPQLIEQPDRIDVRAIEAARDAQIRRCMIDIMTPQRFTEQGGAYRVAQDDTGILWRQRWRWEAWSAVEVVNGTPEPDGTHRRYFLQVPSTVRTAREGVAWTYGLTERQYRPVVRT